MRAYRNLSVIAVLLILGSASIHACSVPVFRYALERWRPAPYEVTVYYRDSLSSSDSAIVSSLHEAGRGARSANIYTTLVDVSDSLEEHLRMRWDSVATRELPRVALYAGHYRSLSKPLWEAPLSTETVEQLLESPVRTEITRRLLAGETAVWVVIPSGDREKDRAVMDTIRTNLDKLRETLEIPEPDYDVGYFEPAQGVPLKIAFSTLVLSPTDPSEEVLRNLLFGGTVPDSLPEPLVIPFTGRGRALITVEGPKVTARTMKQIGRFLTGPCACTVKDANPGTDMLFAVDWDRALHSRPKQEPLPPLAGLEKFAEADTTARARKNDTPARAAATAAEKSARASTVGSTKTDVPAKSSTADSAPRLSCPIAKPVSTDTSAPSHDSSSTTDVLEQMLLAAEADTVQAPAPARSPITRNLWLLVGGLVLLIGAATAAIVGWGRSRASR